MGFDRQFPTPIQKWNLPALPAETQVWLKVFLSAFLRFKSHRPFVNYCCLIRLKEEILEKEKKKFKKEREKKYEGQKRKEER